MSRDCRFGLGLSRALSLIALKPFNLFFVLMISEGALASWEFSVKQHWQWSGDFKFANKRVGGISGATLEKDRLYLISDDKGKFDDPRIYVVKWEQSSEPKILERVYLRENKTKSIWDLEGIAITPKGFLTSSEGDFNRKPRVLPRISLWNREGLFLSDISLDEKWIPEKSGMQSRGCQSNFCMEGLAYDEKNDDVWIAMERPLMQEPEGNLIFRCKLVANASAWMGYPYPLAAHGESRILEVVRGVSEILFFQEGELLVLERSFGIERKTTRPQFSSEIYLAKLKDGKFSKERIEIRSKGEPYLLQANYEAMTWIGNDFQQLLLVSDNNFSKSTPTEFLLLDKVAEKDKK